MATFADIDSWFPNSGTATPASLRTAIKDATGAATVIQSFHAAADATAALTALGGTTTGRAVFTAADAAAARAAISAAGLPPASNVRTGSHSLLASGVPGHEIFNISVAATLTLPLLSACPANSWLMIVNFRGSTAPLTVTRAGSDVIDGLTSFTLYPGESLILAVATTNWRMFNQPIGWRLLNNVTTTGSAATVDLALPVGFSQFELRVNKLNAAAGASVVLRLSVDGGTTYLAGASDYSFVATNNSTTSGSSTSSVVSQSFVDVSAGPVSGAAGDAAFGAVMIRPGDGTDRAGGMVDIITRNGSGVLFRRMAGFVLLASATRATHVRTLPTTGTLTDGSNLQLFGLA